MGNFGYCKRCIQPDTRPGIRLDPSGICSACLGHQEKEKQISWEARRKELETVCNQFRGSNGSGYDCIVPVSGGKDSHYQVYIMKELFGMHPLCVTYRTPLRTELGQRNLDNLQKRLKVDVVELTVSPETERKFILKALREVGDCGLPQHLGIFAFSLRTALNFKIPLIVWGENSQLEYGGSAADRGKPYLDRDWLSRHGCLQERMAEDWVDSQLTLKEMQPFEIPSDEDFAKGQLASIFLGYYMRWDPVENARIARELGFESRKEGPVMGIYDFADLDCKLITFHHYVKWLKFGMTRTFDNTSVEIRNGRMTRKEALDWVRKNKDDMPPRDHMESICNFLQVSEKELFEIIEPFRNKKIWQKDAAGNWTLPGYLEGLER